MKDIESNTVKAEELYKGLITSLSVRGINSNLLSDIEKLYHLSQPTNIFLRSKAEIEKLQEEKSKLIKTLEFYADNNNWIGCGRYKELRINNDSFIIAVISGNGFEIDHHKEVGGKLARETLKQLEGEK